MTTCLALITAARWPIFFHVRPIAAFDLEEAETGKSQLGGCHTQLDVNSASFGLFLLPISISEHLHQLEGSVTMLGFNSS